MIPEFAFFEHYTTDGAEHVEYLNLALLSINMHCRNYQNFHLEMHGLLGVMLRNYLVIRRCILAFSIACVRGISSVCQRMCLVIAMLVVLV